ncbi:hypothetical protein M3210_17785 [Oceanobacillus luteolus]|uniref:Uncharacterized protein n=1 Tax=Oceanobacillus luteolus TaxID=1274358 RepID=A0ABW4HL37_9BACI|nr:hypothetical protein [Oceanobacillus luteolus]MCM3742091.1 hypothetical protein [Oceanobacillus luteolus]
MEEREIYFLFTDTGTSLAKLINFFTKQELNHVSISFTKDFQTLYSFGRKRPKNPFIGGFVHEDITSDFMANADCAIYSQAISECDYNKMMKKIHEFEAKQDDYRYNFIGLFGVLLRIKIERRAALFCSQFVATVIQESDRFTFDKPTCFITPHDIRNLPDNRLIYKGKLKEYQVEMTKPESTRLVLGDQTTPKQSFIYNISNKFKRLVIK